MNTKVALATLAIALAAVAVLLSVSADDSSAAVDDTFSKGGLNYTVTGESGGDGNTVTVTGFTGSTISDFVIPDTVTNSDKTYNVTKIGNSAFAAKGIRSINLGNVKEIGMLAFSGCVQLTEVTGNEVTDIGASAFSGCILLTSFTGGNIKMVGASAFTGCVVLVSIDLSKAINIGLASFMECKLLKLVTLTSAVNIGGYAFYDSGLTAITIPLVTVNIGGSAFNKCSDLEAIVIPTLNLRYKLDNGALVDKITKTIVTLPQSFSGTYVISDGIEKIDDGAFDGCNGLTSVTISSSVNNIGVGVFRNCPNLQTVTVSGGTNYKVMDNCLLTYDGATMIFVPENRSGSFVMPEGVTTIAPYCFSDCLSLTSVDVSAVTDIGRYAFSDCYGMTVMYVNSSATIGVLAFDLGSVGHAVTCEIRSDGVNFIGVEQRNLYTTLNYYLPVEFAYENAPSGPVVPETAWVKSGESLDLTSYKTALSSYTFNVSVDGAAFGENTVPVTTAPRQVTFSFYVVVKYTLSFDTGSGTLVAPYQLEAGEAIPAVSDPIWTGHTFVSWSPEIPATMPANDLCVTAVWSNAVPAGDIVTDGDTKKITTVDNTAELSTAVIEAMKSGVDKVQMDVGSISIKMGVGDFGTLTGTGAVTINAEKTVGITNAALLATLSDYKKSIAQNAVVLNISFVTTGSTSGLGTVTISIPYTLAPGQTAENLTVYYISDGGDLEQLESSYSDGTLSMQTSHFSTFAAASAVLTGPDPAPAPSPAPSPTVPDTSDGEPKSGGMNIGLILGGVIGAIVVIGAVFVLTKKH